MQTLFIIIWLLFGVIGLWRAYHGLLKEWYEKFHESYWKFDKESGGSAIKLLLFFSPILILGGLITIFLFEISDSKYQCWYFTTKNKL